MENNTWNITFADILQKYHDIWYGIEHKNVTKLADKMYIIHEGDELKILLRTTSLVGVPF